MKPITRNPSTCSFRTLIAVGFALVLGTSAAIAGTCTIAVVDEAFVLPDGTERNPGSIAICVERDFTGVQALHEIKVDNMPIGMVLSRHRISNVSDANEHALMFTRATNGRLRLSGYTSPTREGLRIYTLQNSAPRKNPRPNRSMPASQADEPVVLVAAAFIR